MVDPRVRRSVPDQLDLGDSVVRDKFMQRAAVGSREMFDNYSSKAGRIGMESVEGLRAQEIMERVHRHVASLIDRCDRFCPHIDTIPYARPHLILPSLRVVTCLVCSADWFAQADPDDNCCDLCGFVSKSFFELNLQLGPGVLAVNLGDCCIEEFRPSN